MFFLTFLIDRWIFPCYIAGVAPGGGEGGGATAPYWGEN